MSEPATPEARIEALVARVEWLVGRVQELETAAVRYDDHVRILDSRQHMPDPHGIIKRAP